MPNSTIFSPISVSLVVAGVVAALSASACSGGDKPIPSIPTPPPASTPSTSSLTWSITDGCVDGRGLQVRFYDRTNGLVWPGSAEVYIVPAGETRQRTLSCRTDATVCYGARTDPEGFSYWGVDLDGSKSCDNCCTSCRTATVTRELTCR